MRKLLLAVASLLFMGGLSAAEVTLKKYDKEKKELTVTDDKNVEATYKFTDKSKISLIDKDGNAKEVKLPAVEKYLTSEKAVGKMKFDLTAEKDEVSEIKVKMKKK